MTRPRHSPVHRLLAGSGVTSRARAVPDVTDAPQADGAPSWQRLVAESTSPLEAARLLGAGPRLVRMPRGDGHVVVDVPGWRAPELSGLPLRRYLAWLGYDARGWGFGTNTGNPVRDAQRLTRAVAELADSSEDRVSLVGWSLGGVIAREVARSRPDLVRRVITYGTPVVGGPNHTVVAGAYSHEVRDEASRVTGELHASRPITVPLTVMYSRRDGIVSWPACLDRLSPDVEHVEVRSTHVGMGVDPDVWGVVASRLAGVPGMH
ncbi:MAG TPA: alpha/beta hydrolase [Marmoricola sp.]|nr:alpha/beta hydrolase [Marmoricola sp.]